MIVSSEVCTSSYVLVNKFISNNVIYVLLHAYLIEVLFLFIALLPLLSKACYD